MGIRETLNENRGVTVGAAIGITVLALILIFYNVFSGSASTVAPGSIKLYFTIDDGITYFPDDATKIPPFEKAGKQAVLCYVYTCDGGKTKFVSHLERYTADAKKKLTESRAKNQIDPAVDVLEFQGKEVKKPKTGDKGWVRVNDQRANEIVTVKCPDGKNGNIDPVLPQ